MTADRSEDPWATLGGRFVDRHHGTLRGRVRTHVIHQHLRAHLAPPPLRIVDVGGGAGHQSIPLAREGYDVAIVEPSAAMLERAWEHVVAADVDRRVQLVEATGEDAPAALNGERFGAVLCHGVLMYLDDPEPLVDALCALADVKGIVSLVAKNVDLRSGWSQAAGPMTAVDAWDAEFERCRREWVDATRIRVPRAWFDAYDAMTARHKELVDAGRWATGPRSLLGVLGDRSRETKHTVVLAWLLDPNGRHGLGTSLLEAVLHRVDPGTERSLARVRCGIEVECVSVVGFVDVVVWGEDWRLVIENKLWSTQHGDQLDRYHAEFADSSTTLVYLTPEGTRAWSSSPEITAAYRPLSWRRHVIPDLRDAIATTQPAPAVLDYLVALEEELG